MSAVAVAVTPRTERGYWRESGSRLAENRVALASAGLLALFGILALTAPLISHYVTGYRPNDQDLLHTFNGPSGKHWLGTDELGRDVWSRIVYGARTDLRVAFLAVLFPFTIGTLIGLVSGYFGRWVDTLTNWLVNIVVAFPFYVLIIALVFVLGAGTRSIYISITIVGWVSYARIVRGEVLVAKEQEYALAARASGLPTRRILFRHLLPNVVLQAIVYSMSDIVLTILAIVTLGYLGLGVPPPTPDWGSMIQDGQQFLLTQWYLATIPGLAVVLTGLALALVADGLVERFGRR
jgi:peptide/nickel transport system permease protein